VNTRINNTLELLKKFTIIAPSNGMLIYKRDFRGSKRKVGTMIAPFDRIVANIPDLSSMISTTFVSEIDVSNVKRGEKVEITVDAFPKRLYRGTVINVANIGEELANSDSKVFETQIRIEGTDTDLRPSMTTGNKILVSASDNVVYIPTECIQSTSDSIPFVYTKNRLRQVVMIGKSNEKNTIIEKGLQPGTKIYITEPVNKDRFRLSGQELIPLIKQGNRMKSDPSQSM
jgi:multidrug efflux pump subunit AcrA (membrane-fusion protein)